MTGVFGTSMSQNDLGVLNMLSYFSWRIFCILTVSWWYILLSAVYKDFKILPEILHLDGLLIHPKTKFIPIRNIFLKIQCSHGQFCIGTSQSGKAFCSLQPSTLVILYSIFLRPITVLNCSYVIPFWKTSNSRIRLI